jgi:hypothetical protein
LASTWHEAVVFCWQPLLAAHTERVVALVQRAPSGKLSQAGLAGQAQSALPLLPLHCLGLVQVFSTDEVVHPSPLVPQVSTVPVPWQTVPLETPVHSVAAAPHMQSADPGAPPHGLPLVQVFSVDEVAQPSLLVPQVSTVLPLHTVPVTPAHSGATAPQRQSALPFTTLHGLPAGQVCVVDEVTHPLAVELQETTALPEHTVPLVVAPQAAGGLSQRHEALPAEPWQLSAVPQVFMAVMAGHPSELEPQVMRVLPLVQMFPLAPMHAAGAAPHEQEAAGALPVQGLPAGQVLGVPMYTQPSVSARQFSSVFADAQ